MLYPQNGDRIVAIDSLFYIVSGAMNRRSAVRD